MIDRPQAFDSLWITDYVLADGTDVAVVELTEALVRRPHRQPSELVCPTEHRYGPFLGPVPEAGAAPALPGESVAAVLASETHRPRHRALGASENVRADETRRPEGRAR